MKYAIELLEAELWNWKYIKRKMDMEMMKEPSEVIKNQLHECDKAISELSKAIEILKNLNP